MSRDTVLLAVHTASGRPSSDLPPACARKLPSFLITSSGSLEVVDSGKLTAKGRVVAGDCTILHRKLSRPE